jgi:26S proteasome regulatory subunit T3
VALHRHLNALVDVLPPEADSSISLISQFEKLDVTYNDIGGCDIQKQEIREAVELPLTHHELYKQIGIDPPRGVLLYGPPGTGKTMLAKAIANHTTAAFIRVVGSEFVQKYLGEVFFFLLLCFDFDTNPSCTSSKQEQIISSL